MSGAGLRVDLSEIPYTLAQLPRDERDTILASRPIRGPVNEALSLSERQILRCNRTLQRVLASLGGDAKGEPLQLAEGGNLSSFRRAPPPPERAPRRYLEMTAKEIAGLPIDIDDVADPLHPANRGIDEGELIAQAIRDRREKLATAFKDREFAEKQARDHGGSATAYATGSADDPAVRSFAREFGFAELSDASRIWRMPVDSDERRTALSQHFRTQAEATKQRDDLRREVGDCEAALGPEHPSTAAARARLEAVESKLATRW